MRDKVPPLRHATRLSPKVCMLTILRCVQSPNTSDVILAYGSDGTCQNTVISFDTPAQSAQGFRDFGVSTTGPGPDIPIYTAMFDACEPFPSLCPCIDCMLPIYLSCSCQLHHIADIHISVCVSIYGPC